MRALALVALMCALGCAAAEPSTRRPIERLAPSLRSELPPRRVYALDGEVCRTTDPLSEELPLDCAPGLLCCYPCAIRNCQWRCEQRCAN